MRNVQPSALTPHLPAVNKPLDVLILHDAVSSKLSQAIQIPPTTLQPIPCVLKGVLIDLLTLTGLRPSEGGVDVPAYGGNADGNGCKPEGESVCTRRATIITEWRERRFKGSQVIIGSKETISMP